MLAVTIGTGRYAELAKYAATNFAARTGCTVRIFGEAEMKRTGVSDPLYLKFRIFDLVDADEIIYFDADLVCLRDWDPRRFADPKAIVAVRDLMTPGITEDAARMGVPVQDYFNAGLFLANRNNHWRWLGQAEEHTRRFPDAAFREQSSLNAARVELDLPLRLLDRRYNWIRFGEGTLCYQLPVVVAHRLQSDVNQLNFDYFEGRYQLPTAPVLDINDAEMSRWAGRVIVDSGIGCSKACFRLRSDGTLDPSAEEHAEGYWFVYNHQGRTLLAIASATELRSTFEPGPDGAWHSTRQLRPQTSLEREAEARVAAVRWFEYERVGYDRRPLEFLPEGRIGEGQAACEASWHIAETEQGIRLVLRGRERDTCRLLSDSGHPDAWAGEWLFHERMPVRLRPLRKEAGNATTRPCDAPASRPTTMTALSDPRGDCGAAGVTEGAALGLMGYARTGNIGDAAQTVALTRLIGPVRTVVFREEFARQWRADILYIVNAFLCDDPAPSGRNVFFCGVHVHHDDDANARWLADSPYPVGARDPHTVSLLRRRGIHADLVGCATLTFPRYTGVRLGKYAIDADGPGDAIVLSNAGDSWRPHSWERLWTDALGRLETLKTAEVVFTSKLHVALPCLAFGTPLVFDRRRSIQRDRLTLLDELGVRDGIETVVDVSPWADTYRSFLGRVVPLREACPPLMPQP